MKKYKTLIIIAIVLAALCVGVFGLAYLNYNYDKEQKENIETTTEKKIETEPVTTTATTKKQTTTVKVTTTTTTTATTTEKEPEKTKKNIEVKAIYLSDSTVNIKERLDHFINLVNKTGLNTLVIDIKDGGKISYKTKVPLALKHGLYLNSYNPEELIKKLHDNNIYVIGRLVCFKDDKLSRLYPDRAIQTKSGEIWLDRGTAWLNPFLTENWDYNIEIAKEALEYGFDEIQYDYVRFPTGSIGSVQYKQKEMSKIEAINGFLKKSREVLGEDAVLSADVFGIICSSEGDEKTLGQDLETVGLDIDYISPMIYASHYNKEGQEINNVMIEKPDLHPYDVVFNALDAARKRLEKVENYRAVMRPYIQDFTATYLGKGFYQVYGEKQVLEQIQAVYDAGYKQWIFWNGSNKYTEAAYYKIENEDEQ
jgi:hypothetical protein